ncbi:hypothetical protein GCK72_018334 [Caenorhabditis remanei]|uniref:Uncharacterized protein n=1 Tax=Caenorhabditis remanei TaxID=31234 RepID=A0A6A5G9R4_CAERE|nr:hypothetical protein GCK72_018334 [Caenorhabditis remanei]KAF1751780.1 hypothetical protein GCK72_018334 [Caenorhabditis remanei]
MNLKSAVGKCSVESGGWNVLFVSECLLHFLNECIGTITADRAEHSHWISLIVSASIHWNKDLIACLVVQSGRQSRIGTVIWNWSSASEHLTGWLSNLLEISSLEIGGSWVGDWSSNCGSN